MHPMAQPQNCKVKAVRVPGEIDTLTDIMGGLEPHSQKLQTKETKMVRIYKI